ncbi:hypothetical protein DH2020_014268 [Rehmannia glutinosa]|uniref:AP2/ERF domain-containing protein n=1 Tax=Rehmannia glutinosa TaxID=99300 RepID=A0ABR0WVY3_REHGL
MGQNLLDGFCLSLTGKVLLGECRPDLSCDDEADVKQDASFLWAIDKSRISQMHPGWKMNSTNQSRRQHKVCSCVIMEEPSFYPVPQQIGVVKFLTPTAAISSFLHTMVGPQLPNSKALRFNLTDIGARKYKSKKEAAMAYDSAAIKLRNGLSHRNFPWTDIIVGEPNFQNQFSTETILIMIKDGSYASKFSRLSEGSRSTRL